MAGIRARYTINRLVHSCYIYDGTPRHPLPLTPQSPDEPMGRLDYWLSVGRNDSIALGQKTCELILFCVFSTLVISSFVSSVKDKRIRGLYSKFWFVLCHSLSLPLCSLSSSPFLCILSVVGRGWRPQIVFTMKKGYVQRLVNFWEGRKRRDILRKWEKWYEKAIEGMVEVVGKKGIEIWWHKCGIF